MGIGTSIRSPLLSSYLYFKLTSGWILVISFLKDLASLANNLLSINSLTFGFSYSPLIEVIICFNLVVNSYDAFLSIFLRPFNSAFIDFSSPCVNNLNVILILEVGKVKLNSLLLLDIKEDFNSLSSIFVKSTL